jgi:hypothetical protein
MVTWLCSPECSRRSMSRPSSLSAISRKHAATSAREELNQLGSHFGVHPVQVAHSRWAALEQLEEIFVDGRRRKDRTEEVEKEAL